MFNLDVVLLKHLLTALTTLQRDDKQMSNFISLSPLRLLSASVHIVSSSFPTALWCVSPSGCSLAKKMREIDYPARLVGFLLSLVESFYAVA